MGRVPHDHLPKAADLQPERPYACKAQDEKLVTSKPANELRILECCPQMCRDTNQCRVAGIVAEVVIYFFERIEIDQYDREVLPLE